MTPLFAEARRERHTRLTRNFDHFYQIRGYREVWFEDGYLRPAAAQLLSALADAWRHGLDPELYHAGELAAQAVWIKGQSPAVPGRRFAFDVELTAALLLYADHLAHGQVHPAAMRKKWHFERRVVDLPPLLEEAVRTDRVADLLAELTPRHPRYRQLQDLLVRYRDLVAAGGWEAVPDGPKIGLDEEPASPERLAALRARLQAEGDLTESSAAPGAEPGAAPGYGPELAAAVERFQARHGLEPDGVVGKETLAALNVTAGERLEQIVLNLERWRWLPRSFPERYLMVNVPEFQLRGYAGGRQALSMKVVTGRRDWQTPIFGGEISRVEVNPYWHVPTSIALDEVLPQIQEDPEYLSRQGIEILAARDEGGERIAPSAIDWEAARAGRYRFRQRPGPRNALGKIKFLFPNAFNVYLHDTPAERGFTRARRSLSHGCVRLARPLDLASFVFAGLQEHDRDTIEQLVASGRRQSITLSETLPVYILYWTAFLGDDGTAHFAEDVYGYDAALAALLSNGGETPQAGESAEQIASATSVL